MKKKPRILFIYAGGRESRWTAPERDQAPSEFFYGAVELARSGWDVCVMDLGDRPDSWIAGLGNLAMGRFLPVRTRAEHVIRVLAIRKQLNAADVIVGAASYVALALGWVRGLGCQLPPIVGIHCGMANFQPSRWKRRATARVMSRQGCVFFSNAEAVATAQLFGLREGGVPANSFGVDTGFWTPANAPANDGYILAVGNDTRRDYTTLVRAASAWKVPVKILTKRTIDEPLPANVELLHGSWHSPAVTDRELRELYRRAAVVVVPVVDAIQPSGQSVALQAMACGRPVVLSRTRGLWTEDDFIDGEHLKLVPHSEPQALADAVQSMLENPRDAAAMGGLACARTRDLGDIDGFAHRLGEECLKAAAWQNADSTVG